MAFFHTIITVPLFNGLVFLMNLLPFFDAGMIIITFTIIVKIILLPLSIKASRSQLEMKGHEKNLNAIKEKYKDNKEEHGKKQLEYYKENGINPFASFFILLIQFPIIIGLYRVFLRSGFPTINVSMLYSFTPLPSLVNPLFLGLVDITHKSLVLALIAGITAYFQMSLATSSQSSGSGEQSEMAKAMNMQMKYFFPLLMVFIAYTISSAIALYLITSNLFAIAQEIYVKKKYHKNVTVM